MPRFGKPVSSFGMMALPPTSHALSKAKKVGKTGPGKTAGNAAPTNLGGAPYTGVLKGKASRPGKGAAITPPALPVTTGPDTPTSPTVPGNSGVGSTSSANSNTGNGSSGNGNPGNSNAANGNGNSNAANGNGNSSATSGNGNSSATSGNGNSGTTNGNGNSNAANGNGNSNAANGNGNSNAANGNGNTNAANGNGNSNAANGNGNSNAANGNGNSNAGGPTGALPPGWSIVTWEPPGLARKEDGGLPPGLADRPTDDIGLPAGLPPGLERRSVTISREQSTLPAVANPRAALRLQMQRAATRYATMSALTQIAAAQNERAITAAMGRPAPMEVFFGWLRIK